MSQITTAGRTDWPAIGKRVAELVEEFEAEGEGGAVLKPNEREKYLMAEFAACLLDDEDISSLYAGEGPHVVDAKPIQDVIFTLKADCSYQREGDYRLALKLERAIAEHVPAIGDPEALGDEIHAALFPQSSRIIRHEESRRIVAEIVRKHLKGPKDARELNLQWGRHDGRGEYHIEWHAPCGCAYHPEPKPHVHPCIKHSPIVDTGG